ncbi:IS630 family transposase [Methylobacterium sp. NEAU 140]|nr:IS630 family transposase [Methylobacterium sp. NEAU 140]MDP4025979.1 IS630 family transposase [Methylobacterium sp. NEAU 140]
MTLAITRTDLTAEDLRRAARSSKDAAQARRCLAIASVLDGSTRTAAAENAGMQRQTLRDWVHRYNADGVAGLLDRSRPARPGLLSAAQRAEFDTIVETGPDVAVDGVVRWRRIDLKRVIEARFGVVMAERTVGDLLRARGFRHVSVRPRHPNGDEAAQEAFKRPFAAQATQVIPEDARTKPVEIWFQDEARIGQKGTLAYVWARRGTRPRAVQDTRYTSAYLFGAVCPQRGVGAGLVMPRADTEGLNAHLAEIARSVMPGAHAVLVLDGAGWHTSSALVVPGNISLLMLPPYAPELNPVEMIWQYLRRNKLAHRLYDTYDAIVEACCKAWNWLIATPDTITAIASRTWANVSA